MIADTEQLKASLRESLSPDAIAVIIAYLQPACMARPGNHEAEQALGEVEWLHDTLVEILGVEEVGRKFEELRL